MQVPAATPVAVKVADGPFPLPGAIDAICPEPGLQVSLSVNAPLYPVSWTRISCAFEDPVPLIATVLGCTLNTFGGGAVGVGVGEAVGVGVGEGVGEGVGVGVGGGEAVGVGPPVIW